MAKSHKQSFEFVATTSLLRIMGLGRPTHNLRVIASKDISKVAHRNYEMDLGVFGLQDESLADVEVCEDMRWYCIFH